MRLHHVNSAAVVRPKEISSLHAKVNFMLNIKVNFTMKSKVNIMVSEASKVKTGVEVSTLGTQVWDKGIS